MILDNHYISLKILNLVLQQNLLFWVLFKEWKYF